MVGKKKISTTMWNPHHAYMAPNTLTISLYINGLGKIRTEDFMDITSTLQLLLLLLLLLFVLVFY